MCATHKSRPWPGRHTPRAPFREPPPTATPRRRRGGPARRALSRSARRGVVIGGGRGCRATSRPARRSTGKQRTAPDRCRTPACPRLNRRSRCAPVLARGRGLLRGEAHAADRIGHLRGRVPVVSHSRRGMVVRHTGCRPAHHAQHRRAARAQEAPDEQCDEQQKEDVQHRGVVEANALRDRRHIAVTRNDPQRPNTISTT